MGFSSLLLVVQVHGADTDCFVNVRGWSLIIRSGIEKLEEVDTTNLFGLQKTLPILLIVQENLLMRWMHIFLLSAGGGEKRELCKHEEMVQCGQSSNGKS